MADIEPTHDVCHSDGREQPPGAGREPWLLVFALGVPLVVDVHFLFPELEGPLLMLLAWVAGGFVLTWRWIVTGRRVVASRQPSAAWSCLLALVASGLLALAAVYQVARLQRMAHERGSEIARSLLEYRESHGRLPVDLSQLEGTVLDRIPANPYLDGEWRYVGLRNGSFDLTYQEGGTLVWTMTEDLSWIPVWRTPWR